MSPEGVRKQESLIFKRQHEKQPMQMQAEPAVQKMPWAGKEERNLLISEHCLGRQGSWGDPSRYKGAGRWHSPPLLPNINNSHLWKPALCGHMLLNLLTLKQTCHMCFGRSALPSHAPLSPGVPPPEDHPANTTPCDLLVLQDCSSSSGRYCFTSRPLYTLLFTIGKDSISKHLAWREKMPDLNSRVPTT